MDTAEWDALIEKLAKNAYEQYRTSVYDERRLLPYDSLPLNQRIVWRDIVGNIYLAFSGKPISEIEVLPLFRYNEDEQ